MTVTQSQLNARENYFVTSNPFQFPVIWERLIEDCTKGGRGDKNEEYKSGREKSSNNKEGKVNVDL